MGVRIPPGLLLEKSMERKWVHVMFAVAGILLAWLLAKCGDWAWSYFGKPNEFYVGAGAVVLATVATVVAWKNEQLFGLASEVTGELRKVTWPDRKELVSSTIIVIVTTIVSALLLGMFDGIWSWATRMIYG
jgi:preprotein translocase subunit SecE